MSKPVRRSLGDRNRAAITQDAVAERETPKVAPPSPKPETTPVAPVAQDSGTVRQGIYITAEEFADAKAAYLADWQAGGQADTFAKWIGAVLDAHAARSAGERAELARPTGRSETRTGASRSFNIPSDTVERMRAAITKDQAAGRWPSDSAWCGDAIAAAVEQARARAGGELPAPPARLPNRLRR